MSDEELDELYFDAISTGQLLRDKVASNHKKYCLPSDSISANHVQTGESCDTISTNKDFGVSCDQMSTNQGQTGVSGDIIPASHIVDQSVSTCGQEHATTDTESLTDELISGLVQQLEDKILTQTVTEDHSGSLSARPDHLDLAPELIPIPAAISKFSSSRFVDEPVHCSIGNILELKTRNMTDNNNLESEIFDPVCGMGTNTEGLVAQEPVIRTMNPGFDWKLNDELKTVLQSRSKVESQLESSMDAEKSGFVVVKPPKQAISGPIPPVSESRVKQRKAPNVRSKTWLKESKRKSGTLKRNGFPGLCHGGLHSFKGGEVPDVGDDDDIMHMMNPIDPPSDDSNDSFSDSTFDSCASDMSSEGGEDDISMSNKPLPAKPPKKGLFYARPAHSPERVEEESMILTVQPKRYRSPPRLPPAPENRTKEQQKLEGVLKSLSESEISFINSLERLTKEYQDPIINTYGIRRSEVCTAFKKVADILNYHKMFQIELGDKLKKWFDDERIGSIFNHFSQQMVLDIYSDYVNSYGAASEHIKEAELAKPNFREFLKNKQITSTDRLSLAGLMLKPIQRFPQFIMIIKDLLKYTPRDHHDREQLQEGLTGIENVAHQLNERKRQSEQYYHGEIILNKLSKLTPRVATSARCFLIRQDDVDQLSQQDIAGSHNVKSRRLFMMNDKLISVHVSLREQDGPSSERFTFKWSQNLRDLELRMSAIAPHMRTKVSGESGNISIQTPMLDKTNEDPYSVASDLNDMMHDISVLGQISQLVATLKLSYTGLTEDAIQQHSVTLQKQIQGKDYQLQMFNSSSVILWDSVRSKKYIFGIASPQMKQEWCIDFLLAKSALDVTNNPSWHCQDIDLETDMGTSTYLIKHMSLDIQRHFTRVQCAVPVYFPTSTEGCVEHLWVCTARESQGQVSIISLHTAKPGLVESFQATSCEIVCAEVVPGFAFVTNEAAFEDDSVWMSTVDLEILVFVLSDNSKNKQSVSHRKPIHTFRPGCLVVTMTYMDDVMLCGNKNGSVVFYNRDDDGVWSLGTMVILGVGTVISIIPVADSAWVSCGQCIYIVDPEHHIVKGKVNSQHNEAGVHIQHLVKVGVGVWGSFVGRPNICLYHTESHKLLQDFNITSAINEFISVYSVHKENSKDYTVTSLMASLGLLWVGTNVGIVLTYPLPRLRDGVPRIKQRPHVALHGHNQPVMFLIPVHYGPISGTPIRRRPSAILRRSNSKKSPVIDLETVNERSSHEGEGSTADGQGSGAGQGSTGEVHRFVEEEKIYETIEYGRSAPDENEYAELSMMQKGQGDYNRLEIDRLCNIVKGEGRIPDIASEGDLQSSASSSVTSEHNYFILEKTGPGSSGLHKFQENVGNHGNKTDSSAQNENVEGNVTSTNQTVTSTESGKSDKIYVQQRTEEEFLNMSNEFQTGSDVHGKTKAKAMTFRSDLARKLQQRNSKDLVDVAVNETEVERLYEDLMNTESKRNSSTSKTLDRNYRRSDHESDLYFRPRAESPIFARKPSTSLSFNLGRPFTKPNSQFRHSSFTTSTKPDARRVSSSFSPGSTVDMLRKRDTNTMLVLSGGDGYHDWHKKRQNIAYRPDEACLLFWMYKF